MEVALVEWTDSAARHEWASLSELRDDVPIICTSVGFVLRDDETGMVLVHSYDNQEGAAQRGTLTMYIPRRAVVSVDRMVRA